MVVQSSLVLLLVIWTCFPAGLEAVWKCGSSSKPGDAAPHTPPVPPITPKAPEDRYECPTWTNKPLAVFMNRGTAAVEKTVPKVNMKTGVEALKSHALNSALLAKVKESAEDKPELNKVESKDSIVVTLEPNSATFVYQKETTCDVWLGGTKTEGVLQLYKTGTGSFPLDTTNCEDSIHSMSTTERDSEAYINNDDPTEPFKLDYEYDYETGIELNVAEYAAGDDRADFLVWVTSKLEALNPSPITGLRWAGHTTFAKYGLNPMKYTLEVPAMHAGRAYHAHASCTDHAVVSGWAFPVAYPHSMKFIEGQPECDCPEFQPKCFTGFEDEPISMKAMVDSSECKDDERPTPSRSSSAKPRIQTGLKASFFAQIEADKKGFGDAFFAKLKRNEGVTMLKWEKMTQFPEIAKYPVEVVVKDAHQDDDAHQLVVTCERMSTRPNFEFYTQWVALQAGDYCHTGYLDLSGRLITCEEGDALMI